MKRLSAPLAGLSIFTGSFLLFLIQPMIGNFLLPHFGGTASVWIVCLCVFQVLLIAGYGYAHWLGGARHRGVHIALLLVAAAAMIPLTRFAVGVAEGLSAAAPVCAIIVFLLLAVALPYVLVGANGTLVQAVMAKDKGVYRLYAVSNAGSFCGLLGYPFLLEITMTVSGQLRLFAIGVAVYAVLLAALLAVVRGEDGRSARQPLMSAFRDRAALAWFGLSAASCFLLDSVSVHLCSDVTPLPLLWCVLLAIYLLTWIVAFNDRGSRHPAIPAAVSAVLVAIAIWIADRRGGGAFFGELAVGCALLFFGAWFIHARLYAARPGVEKLTGYYFIISVGGAVGGVLAAIVAPLVFSFIAEYPIALAVVAACLFAFVRELLAKRGVEVPAWHVALAVVAVGAVAFWQSFRPERGQLIHQCRNFYGTTKIIKYFRSMNAVGGRDEYVEMENNGITHGLQFTNDSGWHGQMPTAYFSETGGGQCIVQHPLRKAGKPMRVAVLGMGIGTLACHAKAGDEFRFFEIDPNVVRIAQDRRYFTYVPDCDGRVSVVTDDARKALEREAKEGAPKYDLIFMDAFSGDSIPPHLATREAIQLYLDRLTDDGILAFNVTNWHLSLFPLMKAIGTEFNLHPFGVVNTSYPAEGVFESYWTFFSRKPLDFTVREGRQLFIDYDAVPDMPMMTDEFHPLVPYLSCFHDRLTFKKP